jgi:hypothetical protein
MSSFRHRSRPFVGHPPQRRKVVWSSTNVSSTLLSAANNVTNLTTDLVTAGVGVIGSTIVRTHIRLSCSHLNTDTNPGVTYGLIVLDKTLASSPNPATDLNADWMLDSFISPGLSQSAINNGVSLLYGEVIDVKARRRLHEVNDNCFLALVNDGSTTLTYSLLVKQLYMLP